ncbi:MAG: beta galactosidase jelly roll domain-containing protein [Muribaculaceae bacterium]|nr:beta galactosidase jelly roll domain-containing protein [Muribaculaceae bacterium]
MTVKIKRAAMSLAVLAVCAASNAGVKLPSVISDGVIFQRQQPVKIWGKAAPGETVAVSLAGKKASAVAGADSCWLATLPPMKPGGPHVLTVNDVSVNDVLIGDLYLCSGQSNMELPVNRVLDFYKDEVAAYANPYIREFKTPKNYTFETEDYEVAPAVWKKAVPGESEKFGALVYFMAKDLYEKNGHVPVGVVNSSWGGSRIEAWLSRDALAAYPERLHRLELAADDAYRGNLSTAERRAQNLWYAIMNRDDPGYHDSLKWNAPTLDDDDWSTTELLGKEWGSSDGKPVNGSHWLRKTVSIPTEHAGEEAELRLGCIVDADSVWVNGTFVGFTAYQYPPRIYRVPAGVLTEGDNLVCVRVVSNGGVPHFVPEKPHKFIFNNGDEVSLEGEWRHKTGCVMPPTPSVTDFFQTPSVLYNGLIAPMRHLPFRGVVWYQGESDVDIRSQYAALMKSLMADWRATFADDALPFYIVELADFLHPSDTYGRRSWQEMRDAQRLAAEETHDAEWIKNGDIGEWNDIHPRDKKTPGTRVSDMIVAHPHR